MSTLLLLNPNIGQEEFKVGISNVFMKMQTPDLQALQQRGCSSSCHELRNDVCLLHHPVTWRSIKIDFSGHWRNSNFLIVFISQPQPHLVNIRLSFGHLHTSFPFFFQCGNKLFIWLSHTDTNEQKWKVASRLCVCVSVYRQSC